MFAAAAVVVAAWPTTLEAHKRTAVASRAAPRTDKPHWVHCKKYSIRTVDWRTTEDWKHLTD